METVVIDLDGVVYDLHSALDSYLKDKYSVPNYNINRVLTYDFNKSLDFSLVDEDFFIEDDILTEKKAPFFGLGAVRADVLKALGDPEIYAEAPLFDGVVDAIDTLRSEYKVCLHSLALNTDVVSSKSIAVAKDFKIEDNLEVSLVTGDTKSVRDDATIVVEDCAENLVPYVNMGCTCYLIDKPYNQEKYNKDLFKKLKGVRRVKTLSDAIDCIMKGA